MRLCLKRYGFLVCMSFVLCALVACGGRDGESGYVVEQAAWGYSGPNGPEQWASLAPENAPCAEGVQQSPVDLTGYERASAPALSFSYDGGVSGAALVRGSIVVSFGPASSLTLGGRHHDLRSAHAHAPAEHRVDGEEFAAELHVLHEDESGALLAVGVLYRLGAPSPVLQAMIDGFGRRRGVGIPAPSGWLRSELLRLLHLPRFQDDSTVPGAGGVGGHAGRRNGVAGADRRASGAERRAEQQAGPAAAGRRIVLVGGGG